MPERVGMWPSAKIAEIVHARSAPKTFGVILFTEEQRRAALIGRRVEGQLMHTKGGYFVKWNMWKSDSIYVSEEVVQRDCGPQNRFGALAEVECTIEKLGPSYAHWEKQHPFTTKLDLKHTYQEQVNAEDVQNFRAYLFDKRQTMPYGPCGTQPGEISSQRSAPALLSSSFMQRGSLQVPRPRSHTCPEDRHSKPVVRRSRSGSYPRESRTACSSGTRTPIQLCRPRRHQPVEDTPGAFLAQDLNGFRRKKFEPAHPPVYTQKSSVGKLKGGKPMNLRFRSSSDPVTRNVPERFRNLNEDLSCLGVTWKPSNYHSVLCSNTESDTSSVPASACSPSGGEAISFLRSLQG